MPGVLGIVGVIGEGHAEEGGEDMAMVENEGRDYQGNIV